MEKLYQTHINLMIFFILGTLSVSFTFAGKVQQCLVSHQLQMKYICYCDAELKTTHTFM